MSFFRRGTILVPNSRNPFSMDRIRDTRLAVSLWLTQNRDSHHLALGSGFKFRSFLFLARLPWADYLTSLDLHFLTSKMKIV